MAGKGHKLPFDTKPIYKHLEATFGSTTRTPANLFWHYYREIKDANPMLRAYDIMDSALSAVNNLLTNHPYQAITLGERIQLPFLDKCLLQLPVGDSWHVGYDDPKRIDGMVDAVFDKAWQSDNQELVDWDKVVDDVCAALDNNIANVAGIFKQNSHPRSYWVQKIKQSPRLKMINSQTCMGMKYFDNVVELSTLLNRQCEKMPRSLDNKLFNKLIQPRSYSNIRWGNDQIDAAKAMLQRPLSVLIGYAGTGKTTLLNLVLRYLQEKHMSVQLTAISGKACQNLFQHTGHPALTIAKLLYSDLDALRTKDYLIIDEISMVDEIQMCRLLAAIGDQTHVIILGDRAQLPAVGGVGMLTDMNTWSNLKQKHPDTMYYHELTHVYRQGQNNLLDTATRFRKGQVPETFDNSQLDASLRYMSVKDVPEMVDGLYNRLVPKHLSVDQAVILGLENKDVELINVYLHKENLQKHNVSKTSVGFKNYDRCSYQQFYPGDRVLVTKNMYKVFTLDDDECDLFNGFVGTITEMFVGETGEKRNPADPFVKGRHLVVQFDQSCGLNRVVRVPFLDLASRAGRNYQKAFDGNIADLTHLALGYALTVHKAQGSTMDTVIVYVGKKDHMIMLKKELLYTAFTRPSRMLFFTSGKPITKEFFEECLSKSVYQYSKSVLSRAI